MVSLWESVGDGEMGGIAIGSRWVVIVEWGVEGDKEDWEGVIELGIEGNGVLCEFWSVDGKSVELGRLKGGGVGEW